MAFFSSAKAVRVGFALGKIPTSPEFLRARGTREPTRSFDAWLESSMDHAANRHGAAWTSAFERAAPLGFVWRAPRAARADTVLVGLLVPSHDAVGRHYPLVLAAEVELRVLVRTPHVAPLAFGMFLEQASELADLGASLDPVQLVERAAALHAPTADDITRAADEYETWTRQTLPSDAWSTVLEGASASDIPAALRDLTTTVRDRESPDDGPTLRVPLGRGGNAAAALWLDLVRRVCRWKSTVASAFWDIDTGTMLVALGNATPALLPAIWLPSSVETGVCDPTHVAPPSHGARSSHAATLHAMLAGVGA